MLVLIILRVILMRYQVSWTDYSRQNEQVMYFICIIAYFICIIINNILTTRLNRSMFFYSIFQFIHRDALHYLHLSINSHYVKFVVIFNEIFFYQDSVIRLVIVTYGILMCPKQKMLLMERFSLSEYALGSHVSV